MNFVKENGLTILLIFLICITIIVFSIFVYNMTSEEANNSNIVVVQEGNIRTTEEPIFEKQEEIEEEPLVEEQEDIEEPIPDVASEVAEEDDDEQTQESMLTEIADIFNRSDFSQKIRTHNVVIHAIAVRDTISILYGIENIANFQLQFTLNEDNILYTRILVDEEGLDTARAKVILATILIDCVGQAKGLPVDTLYDAFCKEESANYTLENEGVEVRHLTDEQGTDIKIDLNNDFSFFNT